MLRSLRAEFESKIDPKLAKKVPNERTGHVTAFEAVLVTVHGNGRAAQSESGKILWALL